MPAGREAVGGEAAGAVQPAHRPARGELELGLAIGVGGELVDRRQQQLLDGPLERPQRQALLDRAVGGVLVEALERGQQAAAVGRRRLALAGELDRRGDVAGLGERVAQGLQLDQLVVAVVARRCASASGSRSGAPSCAGCWG